MLKQILDLLQPLDSNKKDYLNENKLEIVKEIEEGMLFGIDIDHKHPDQDDSDWILDSKT